MSDIETVRTESAASDMTRERKPETTVAMDYGCISLPDGIVDPPLRHTGPGNVSTSCDILTVKAASGSCLLDNVRPDPINDLSFFIAVPGPLSIKPAWCARHYLY